MKNAPLKSMSVEELMKLRARVDAALEELVTRERKELQSKLERLSGLPVKSPGPFGLFAGEKQDGRKSVAPKYRNPKNRSETWSGRGKKPRWLVAELKAGKSINDFLISAQGTSERRKARH